MLLPLPEQRLSGRTAKLLMLEMSCTNAPMPGNYPDGDKPGGWVSFGCSPHARYPTDISRWQDAARAHGEFFGEIRPACTFMQVSAFIDPQWLVELEADCIVSS